jgi:hypothetical protein
MVVLETLVEGQWRTIAALDPTDPPGSFSSHVQGRQVWMFGFWEGQPGVWLSVAGFDVASEILRAVSTVGLEQVSDLSEPWEATVVNPTGQRYQVRVSLV